jgi:hypothetical protein
MHGTVVVSPYNTLQYLHRLNKLFTLHLPLLLCLHIYARRRRRGREREDQCECIAAHRGSTDNTLFSNIKTVHSYVRCVTTNSLSKVPDTNPITSSWVQNSAIVVQCHIIELELSCWEGLRDIWVARQCDARWTVEQQELQVSSTQIFNPFSYDTYSNNNGFLITHRCTFCMTNKLHFRNFCDALTCHNTHNGNDYSRVYKAGVIGNYISLNHSEDTFCSTQYLMYHPRHSRDDL